MPIWNIKPVSYLILYRLIGEIKYTWIHAYYYMHSYMYSYICEVCYFIPVLLNRRKLKQIILAFMEQVGI